MRERKSKKTKNKKKLILTKNILKMGYKKWEKKEVRRNWWEEEGEEVSERERKGEKNKKPILTKNIKKMWYKKLKGKRRRNLLEREVSK